MNGDGRLFREVWKTGERKLLDRLSDGRLLRCTQTIGLTISGDVVPAVDLVVCRTQYQHRLTCTL